MTKIEWADVSWNPITGCTKISPGCKNCYAERFAKRLRGRAGYSAKNPFKVTWHPDKLDQPKHWRKPRMIFTVSMGDLFHPDIQPVMQATILGRAHHFDCPQHTYLVLTKRPQNAYDFFVNNSMGQQFLKLKNLWLGVSVENQDYVWRIEQLLEIPIAGKYFASLEPLLGPVDLRPYLQKTPEAYKMLSRFYDKKGFRPEGDQPEKSIPRLDWIVAGGETGSWPRPSHPDWFRKLRDQANGVSFFFKGWGSWKPELPIFAGSPCNFITPAGKLYSELEIDALGIEDGCCVRKVGKKAAGRLLDGREWNEIPGAS